VAERSRSPASIWVNLCDPWENLSTPYKKIFFSLWVASGTVRHRKFFPEVIPKYFQIPHATRLPENAFFTAVS